MIGSNNHEVNTGTSSLLIVGEKRLAGTRTLSVLKGGHNPRNFGRAREKRIEMHVRLWVRVCFIVPSSRF
jgi:hypothetical protein